MQLQRTRLDRFVSKALGIARREVRLLLARQRLQVDGKVATDINQVVGPFSHITLDGQVLQFRARQYVMLNKPAGVVSATRDNRHPTVVDLLPASLRGSLHIAGRLDFHSTGLILLTNDGHWSRRLSLPDYKMVKRYRVVLESPLNASYVDAFRDGMFFEYEGVVTQPAELVIISKYVAQVSLTEGRYHQIKRMFGRFRNRVLSLHRLSIGPISLDLNLAIGESRPLNCSERLATAHLRE